MRRLRWLAVAVAASLASIPLARLPAAGEPAHAAAVRQQLATIERRQRGAEMSCAALMAQHPVVLLVLGQSNAANHGVGSAPQPAIAIFFRGRCFSSHDPLPGGSGDGASLWPRVAANLGGRLHGRPLLFAQLAVESTTIADWTAAGPLRDTLGAELHALARSGLAVDAVLWQQGEADALAHTATQAYGKRLAELRRSLAALGVHAPFVAALSTYCPGSDGSAVRAAIRRAALSGDGLIVGPDTDQLQGAMRSGGCHFSEKGLDTAADEWAATLRALEPRDCGAAGFSLAKICGPGNVP